MILTTIIYLQELYPYLKKKSSKEPGDGTLFFIPVYTAQLYHSVLLNEGLNHQDSLNRTAELVREALNYVKLNFPYWKRTNGLDHFMIMPLDHGRCTSMAGLTHDDFGDMFVIQPSGDQFLKDFETQTWKCFMPGRDVVIPIRTEARFTMQDIVKPWETERNISILYRFVGGGRGDYGVLRSQLLGKENEDPIPGSLTGWQSVNGTHEDMRHSVFCVCPPGIAQHTLRVWRAIIFGCIPVTLFSANDRPFEAFANLDYTKFSVNVHSAEWHVLQPIIRGLLARPERIAAMQLELAKVQSQFLWDSSNFEGAFTAVYNELSLHPAQYLAKSDI